MPCVCGAGRVRKWAGPAAVLVRGGADGRKPKLDDQQAKAIKALLHNSDIQVVEAARRYGVSRTTLYKHVGIVTPRR